MFSDSPVSYVEFQSGSVDADRRDRTSRNANIQTEPLYIREGGIQTVRRKTVEIQTDISAPILGGVDGEYFDDGAMVMDMPNDDPTALNAFARRMGPLMLSELEANAASPVTTLLLGNWATARTGRSRQIEVDTFGFAIVEDPQNQQQPQQQQTEEGCTLLRRVFGPDDTSNSSAPADTTNLPASCLSWSPSGASLAVGFGHIRHDSWCAHGTTAAVYIWSLETFRSATSANSSNLNKEANTYKPVWVLPHSACVTALSFHPSTAGLLASGSFTGDVVVWDISRDESTDPLLASTAGMALAQPGMNVPHADFIGDLAWLPIKASPTVRFLASACGDGLVCTWSVDFIRRTISQLAGYKFPAGVCCLSMNPHDSTVLAAGLANGQLVFWSVDASKSSEAAYALDPSLSTPSTPVYTVTGLKISAASGPIYSCEWSPACQGLCVVATSDGAALLYSQREPTMPCLRLECSSSGSLFSICFSRSRPLLLLAASQYDGAVGFDLSSSKASSVSFHLQSETGGNNQVSSTLCAAFNPSSARASIHSLIALGRESGAVELWRVSMASDSNEADSLQVLRALVAESPQERQQQIRQQKDKEKAAASAARNAAPGEVAKKKKKKRPEEKQEDV